MCNVLNMNCMGHGCESSINMHLADNATDPGEIWCYCGKHVPEDRNDGILWEYKRGRKTVKVFVKALTPNAKDHARGNHPNKIDIRRLEQFGDEVVEEFN